MPGNIVEKPQVTEKTKRFEINANDWKATAKNLAYFAGGVGALALIYGIDLYMNGCFDIQLVWNYFYSVFAAGLAFSIKRFLTDYTK